MSLKTKIQQDKIRKFLNSINVGTIIYIVEGTIGDVLEGNHPDDMPMIPGITAGQLRSNPSMRKDRNFIEQVVGAAVGRLAHQWCMINGIDMLLVIPMLGLTTKTEQTAINLLLNSPTVH
jgi:hypothetical protein